MIVHDNFWEMEVPRSASVRLARLYISYRDTNLARLLQSHGDTRFPIHMRSFSSNVAIAATESYPAASCLKQALLVSTSMSANNGILSQPEASHSKNWLWFT